MDPGAAQSASRNAASADSPSPVETAHPGARVFPIHLDSDPRGPARVRERHRVRAETEWLVDTHPLW